MRDNIYSGCTVNMQGCDCLSKLTPDEVELMDKNSNIISYKKGEIICKEGTFASHVMYMQKGLAKVFIESGNNSLVLKIIPEGNLLGLTSLSRENSVFQYSSIAYIDCIIKQIDINIFRRLLELNSAFALSVIDLLNARSTQMIGRFFCLTHKQSFGRLADIIICLSERVYKSNEFELPLSRKELAELSGMSTETVIRILKKFKEDKLIEIKEKKFKILNIQKMISISENG